MSGENRQILRDSTTNFDPYFMTLDHINQRLYWTDSPATRIESSNVDGTDYTLLTTGAHGALGVAHYNGTVYYTDEDFRGVNELAPDGTRTRLQTEPFVTRGIEVIAYSTRPIPGIYSSIVYREIKHSCSRRFCGCYVQLTIEGLQRDVVILTHSLLCDPRRTWGWGYVYTFTFLLRLS